MENPGKTFQDLLDRIEELESGNELFYKILMAIILKYCPVRNFQMPTDEILDPKIIASINIKVNKKITKISVETPQLNLNQSDRMH